VTLRSFTVRINDRRVLTALVRAAGFPDEQAGPVLITLDKIDKIGASGVQGELAGRGVPAEQAARFITAVQELEKRALSGDADLSWIDLPVDRGALDGLAAIIRAVRGEYAAWAQRGTEVEIRFDPTLVRGMGYYTGPIFEIAHTGYPSSIAGGGRYDDMVGRFLGRAVPACGFSIGFERLVEILEEREDGRLLTTSPTKVALLVDEPLRDLGGMLTYARERRAQGAVVLVEPRNSKGAGRQLYQLAREGFTEGRAYMADGSVEDLGTALGEKAAAASAERA
jgi:histidyl-tRNA synthetase